MSLVPCRKCGQSAPYSYSDRRGDVHVCQQCDAKTVYPIEVDPDEIGA